ncbi:MAG: S9 family peptidase [Sphingomonas sanxanigenens]|uniref:S9 family peptidase n=1 Tax=Sphingomonas sanxanigenens TaxID=397260 RepID=A0A2W5ABX5_9SPHN|nr:MAG: S9 family peptidase [Sphingomonas sanxanigenens]
MRHHLRTSLIALAAILAAPIAAADSDPNAYLENVDGARALDQVKAWNKATLDVLAADPHFAAYRDRALTLLQDDAQIAEPDRIIGGNVLNLWRDAKNPRGLWRIASLDSFAAGKPQWRVLIDVDALGKAEGKSWVWKGATCRAPAYDRCIIALADGGTDAAVEREFDMASASFVSGGFTLPAAKTGIAWAGPDALYVSTDFGPGSLTSSGYARIVKLWKRGTPITAATTLFEGQATDVSVGANVSVDGDRSWPIVRRGVDFYHSELRHVAPDGKLIASPLPTDADLQDILDGRAIALLNKDWRGIPAGSLVAYRIDDVLAGRTPAIERVFTPGPTQAIEEVSASKSLLWVKLLDDVSGKLLTLSRQPDGRWAQGAATLPANSTVHLNAAAGVSDLAFATVEGMLTPPTLYAVAPARAPQIVQALPARFDAANMQVEQRFASSKDGAKVPYFLVRRKDVKGPVPALIHAYGGFRLAQTPTYLVDQPYRAGPAGLFWVEEGNVFVLANIRGGGEYGPRWHDAALREKRQNAYDDLHAVAEDLIRAGISAPKRIAVSGRSNGGLLVGVAMTQRPDLYGAVVMGSPLTDMKRYSHLLAGASWMGEYGDPDKPADWAFISRYSPYQNLKAGVKYPVPFIYTSTRDDRVHPAHARKFAAKLGELGDQFFYSEAIEGGHAAGADRKEDAQRAALIITYLNRELPGETK